MIYQKRTIRADIEQVLREKKSFTLRCMLDGIKELQGRVAKWNRFASSVSIIYSGSQLDVLHISTMGKPSSGVLRRNQVESLCNGLI
jgi:hypothetical protein